MAALVQVCDAALERMSTRIEEDEALLAELPPGRRRLSVEFRLQKKRLLQDVAELLRRQKACLEDRDALFSSLLGGQLDSSCLPPFQ